MARSPPRTTVVVALGISLLCNVTLVVTLLMSGGENSVTTTCLPGIAMATQTNTSKAQSGKIDLVPEVKVDIALPVTPDAASNLVKDIEKHQQTLTAFRCGVRGSNEQSYKKRSGKYNNIFADLSTAEMNAVYAYLKGKPDIRVSEGLRVWTAP